MCNILFLGERIRRGVKRNFSRGLYIIFCTSVLFFYKKNITKKVCDQILKQCSKTVVSEDALTKKNQLEKNSQATQEIFGTPSTSS